MVESDDTKLIPIILVVQYYLRVSNYIFPTLFYLG